MCSSDDPFFVPILVVHRGGIGRGSQPLIRPAYSGRSAMRCGFNLLILQTMKREDGSGLAFDRLERLAKARNIPVIDLYVICDRTRTVPPAPQEQADAPSVLLDPSVELALLQKPGPQPTGSLLVPRQHEI